jgi:hypothetical protein
MTMTDRPRLEALLKSVLERPGIAAAIVAAEDGATVAMQPSYDDPSSADATMQWTASQVKIARDIRRGTEAQDFVLPHPGTHHLPYTHVSVINRHFLLIVYATDDELPIVRAAVQKLRASFTAALSADGGD